MSASHIVAEEWRAVPEWEGYYEVSDQGRVRSLDRTTKKILRDGAIQQARYRGRVLRPVMRHRYPVVTLVAPGRRRTILVHHLVLGAFVGPRPDEREGCHFNDITTDNRLNNLRWDTSRANKLDCVRNGNHHHSRKTHCTNGHRYIPENTRVDRHGHRICRVCRREQHRRAS